MGKAVKVILACGCETVWQDDESLYLGCDAYCHLHDDTHVTEILYPVTY